MNGTMDDAPRIPTALKVVAALFILSGFWAILEILGALLQGHIYINLGVIGVFVGLGLLALRPGWRTCALVLLWIAMIAAPFLGLLMLFRRDPIDVVVFGRKVGDAPGPFGLFISTVIFLLAFWQYRVLTRPDIRALFGLPIEDGEPPQNP